MLNQNQFTNYCEKLNLKPSAVSYLENTRSSPPSRPVGDHALLNMACRFASQKMGLVIQAESRTVEMSGLIQNELRDDVLEIWDQPTPIPLERKKLNGKVVRSEHTPDYLLLTTDGPVAVECKPQSGLDRLMRKRPEDWAVTDGKTTYIPALFAAQNLGIAHTVVVSENIFGIKQTNLELMVATRYGVTPPDENELYKRTTHLLQDGPKTIAYLCECIDGLNDSLVIHWVSRFMLFSCVDSQLLTDRYTSYVFLNQMDAQARNSELKEMLAGLNADFDQDRISRVLSCTAKAFAKGQAIQTKYQDVLDGKRAATRHERRFPKSLIEEDIRNGRPTLYHFIPNYRAQGSRQTRLSKDQIDLYHQGLKLVMKSVSRATPTLILAKMDQIVKAKNLNIKPMSLESTRLMLKKVDQAKIALAFAGIRAFQSERAANDPRYSTLRTVVPGLIVHIDSTQWDEKLWKKSPLSEALPCPWVYTAWCEGSERCVGATLGFGKSDTFALAALIRDMVRRIGFLPNFIIVDRGSEFTAEFFQILSAAGGVHVLYRPAGSGRSGSLVETRFKLLNEQVAHRLSGSTLLDKAGRRADGKKKGRHTARIGYGLALDALRWYLFEHANVNTHGTAPACPDDLWVEGRQLYPMVGMAPPKNDEDWDIATSVPVSKNIKIDRIKGIRTTYRTYTSVELMDEIRQNHSAEAFSIDPENPTVMYVKFRGNFVKAWARNHLAIASLPADAQLADQFLQRLQANENRKERRFANAKLDERIDEIEAAATEEHKEVAKAAAATEVAKVIEMSVFAAVANKPSRQPLEELE